jgi:nucleoside-diphosphate-sugar epimerase
LLFGCGYVGRRFAEQWIAAGHRVTAATRSKHRAEELKRAGIEPVVCDVTDPKSLAELPVADWLVYAVGYDRTSEPSIAEVYAGGLANVLAAIDPRVQRVVYVSSTGVYGDAEGEWIDERTEPAPHREGGAASLAAERVLSSSAWGERGTVLRLAGIYGPGRIPYFDRLRAGEPIEAVPTGWLNLIHADDAARAIAASLLASEVGCYNVSDGSPVVRGDYYAEIARLVGAEAPRFTRPPDGSSRASRSETSRRISNRLMTDRLLPELLYPSYREGLAAILAARPDETAPS